MRRLAGLFALLTLVACGEPAETPTGEEALDAARQQPLYVYASYSNVDYLPALFRRYTDETGVVVVVRHRSDRENLDDMAAKSGSQPADVLLTSSVWSIWQAADEGLLRPLPRSLVEDVDPRFSDPDQLWVSLSLDPIVVASAGDGGTENDYRALPGTDDSLCVSSSALASNRILLAWMIAESGERETEIDVRRWVAALGLPPRDTDDDVLSAVAGGSCDVGITTRSVLGPDSALSVTLPEPLFYDIEGVGVGRHAESPDAAADLIAWLLRDDIQRRHSEAQRRLPVVTDAAELPGLPTRGIAAAGFLYPDAIRLAERARYR